MQSDVDQFESSSKIILQAFDFEYIEDLVINELFQPKTIKNIETADLISEKKSTPFKSKDIKGSNISDLLEINDLHEQKN